MPYTSQFTVYQSSDIGGPGPITGVSGSLLSILDACLVNGYTGKPGAGWTKPFANSGSIFGAWTQGTGSKFTLFMNDGGFTTAAGKEASVVGWQVLSQIGPTGTGANHVGTGQGQFPLPNQALTTGRLVWRKSGDTTTQRPWIVAADSSSFYMWIQTDTAGQYRHHAFGDIYSFRGESDLWNCIIMGQNTDNTNNNASNAIDYLCDALATPPSNGSGNWLTVGQSGHFMPANAWGAGVSFGFAKRGDAVLCPLNTFSGFGINSSVMAGVMGVPNIYDGTLYMAPLEAIEAANPFIIRGKIRGLYHVCHPVANFADGQVLSGSGDFSGKTFQIIRTTAIGSFWALETSPTVDTN